MNINWDWEGFLRSRFRQWPMRTYKIGVRRIGEFKTNQAKWAKR